MKHDRLFINQLCRYDSEGFSRRPGLAITFAKHCSIILSHVAVLLCNVLWDTCHHHIPIIRENATLKSMPSGVDISPVIYGALRIDVLAATLQFVDLVLWTSHWLLR